MKSLFKFAICAMTVIAVVASCNKNEEEGAPTPPVAKVQKTWTAGFTDLAPASGSQGTALSVVLSQDDAISVFSGRQNQKIAATSVDAEKKTAVFSGEVVEASTYYALYPYQQSGSSSNDAISANIAAEQTLTEGSVDPAARFYVAKSATEKLQFTPAFGLIAITTEAPENIASMKLSTSQEADRLSGVARINLTNGNIVVVSGTNTVTLNCEPKDGKVYYASVIPGTFTGLTLSAVNKDGLTAEFTLSESEFVVKKGEIASVSVDFADAQWILRPYENQSYELKTAAEVTEFVKMKPTPKEEVVDLTISGTEITDELLAQIKNRVGSVRGSLVWDNVGATTTAGFFDNIECKSNVTLKNCAALTNASGFVAYETIGGDLTIENCPQIGQGWNALKEVKGAFKLSNCPLKFGQEGSFAALETVGGDFVVENMGEGFTSFAGCALTTIGGNVSITGNVALADLTGLDGLYTIGGTSVTIFENPMLVEISEEVKGYCLVRDFMDASVLNANATVKLGTTASPVDFANLPACDGTRPGDLKSYVLNGSAEVQRFVAGATEGVKESVRNLTFKGDVTNDDLSKVKDRVGKITGTLTFEDITWVEGDGWGINTLSIIPSYIVDGVFEGSVVFRRVDGIINVNGFEGMTEIKGDFVVEDCPNYQICDWEGATKNLKKVGGDFRRINCDSERTLRAETFTSLEEVGGDFELAGFKYLWSLNGVDKLTSIGGDLIIRDCPEFWGFNGFHNLTYLGGNVVVTNYGKLPVRSGLVDGEEVIGICFFRDLMDNGGMNSGATFTFIKDTTNPSETTVDFSTVVSCSAVMDDDKLSGHEKYPDPDPITGWN